VDTLAKSVTTAESDDISQLLGGLKIGRSVSNFTAGASPATVSVRTAGVLVPQSSIIELKTRSFRAPFDRDDVYPQLFFSQTPLLYLARYDRGRFSGVEDITLSSMTREATAAASGLRKLAAELENILKMVRKGDMGKKLSLVYSGGALTLYKREEGGIVGLPQELAKLFQ
jgi:hypothetical protein